MWIFLKNIPKRNNWCKINKKWLSYQPKMFSNKNVEQSIVLLTVVYLTFWNNFGKVMLN